VAAPILRLSTGPTRAVENATVAAEPGHPPTSLLVLDVENVMAEAVAYCPLTRWVEGEGGGTAAEEEQRSRTDRTKTALPSTVPPSHESRDMAVDSLVFELLVVSSAHGPVEAATAERLWQY
jgi:hypothetical protein